LTVLWGLSFPLIKIALQDCGTFTFLTARFLVGTILIYPFLKNRDKNILLSVFKPGLILGLLVFIGFASQAWGLSITTASKSGFLTGTLVIMVPFMAIPVLKQKVTLKHMVAAFSAMMGIFFLTRPDMGTFNAGDMLTLVCALAFAAQTVYIQKVGRADLSLALAFYQVMFILVASVPVAGIFEGFSGFFSPQVWIVAGIVGTTSTGLGFYLQTHYQPMTTAQSAAVIYTMEPVFASIFAGLILSENFPSFLGAVFIIAGMVIAEWKRR